MSIESLDCLSCDGRGEYYYICQNRMLKCVVCDGTGKVMRDAAWVEQGERLRQARLDKDLSLREAAQTLGVKALTLSGAERGRADPSPYLNKIYLGSYD